MRSPQPVACPLTRRLSVRESPERRVRDNAPYPRASLIPHARAERRAEARGRDAFALAGLGIEDAQCARGAIARGVDDVTSVREPARLDGIKVRLRDDLRRAFRNII